MLPLPTRHHQDPRGIAIQCRFSLCEGEGEALRARGKADTGGTQLFTPDVLLASLVTCALESYADFDI